jgi:anaerobic magnesium-protoporphyrin IX monomethyl ester cyclase
VKDRVVLFNPQSDFYAMPLGLLAVGSALSADKYEVSIFDARIDGGAEQRVLDAAEGAACAGMTVFSGPSIGNALRLSREIKKRHPSLPVIWGGWHPSILPEQCIASGAVDAVVIAQGEGAFSDLLENIGNRQSWATIPGLCVAEGGMPKRTPPRRLQKMEQFPPARYELLDVDRYFERKGKRQLDYSSSRGCPYKCTFCADPLVYESKWTGLPADRILAELQELHHRYAMTEVFFLDDDLFASLKRIQEIASQFLRARVPFEWKGTARADELCRLPESFFKELRAAGCTRINVGAESGSQRVLDGIKKEYQVEQIIKAGERTSRAGIGVSWSFIAGLPGEQSSDFDATLKVIKKLRQQTSTVEANLFVYSLYPGTELSRELERKGVRMPERLEEWERFNSDQAWDSGRGPGFKRRVSSVNFYLRHGYASHQSGASRSLLRAASRARCERDWYGFPVERVLIETVQRLKTLAGA